MMGQILNDLFPATERTRFVLVDPKDFEIGIKRIVNEKAAYEWLSPSQNEFENLSGLNQAYLPGHNSQDTDFTSGGDKVLLRRYRHHASQAGASGLGMKDARLPFKSNGRTENIGFARKETSVIQKILRWEVVRSVKDNVELPYDRKGVYRP